MVKHVPELHNQEPATLVTQLVTQGIGGNSGATTKCPMTRPNSGRGDRI
jgi:hypothetical protein